ncbi:hypothetical protein DFQ14_102492 [Halopolyspora algeriensis]|uniref:PRC-barrel domain protein n=1 Tax=Halopolyspora algeriensis TaxID=1500506 RepID=A0A368VWG2_9ACTN|nr:PRC-barrel domain containing protein [Halopolyspora algeriensis]RCW46189.1 hypothetical protein DFQ14_102492 [Halopolyspora algeriensis]TQM55592.1 hypothetical protein FHU43_0367 [Halopolyspora algeriensis]
MSTAPQPEDPRVREWTGSTVVDRDGTPLGELEHVYLGRSDNQPTWGLVRAGQRQQFVPLHQAGAGGGTVQVSASQQQVSSAPEIPAGSELQPEAEWRLTQHYWPQGEDRTTSGAYAQQGQERGSPLSVRRSRGMISGMLLIPLGIWGALVPFIGPYFGYGFGSDQPWLFTMDRLWLSILPGLAVLLGGLMLAPSANRITGGLGAWLALAGGMWFLVGPSIALLWGSGGPDAPFGVTTDSTVIQVLEQLGYFFALGALTTTLAAFALGRLAVRSVRD